MTPKSLFDAVWERSSHISAIHAYLATHSAAALRPDELLRAEWAMRVSALDLYVHELVAQRMLEIFDGTRAQTPAFSRWEVTYETLGRIRAASSAAEASAAFDLQVRQELGRRTFQYPDDIADGIRLISTIELWNAVAAQLGAGESQKVAQARLIRQDLSLIVGRRNKIVHEGDLAPSPPRTPWPVSQTDLGFVRMTIEKVVVALEAVV